MINPIQEIALELLQLHSADSTVISELMQRFKEETQLDLPKIENWEPMSVISFICEMSLSDRILNTIRLRELMGLDKVSPRQISDWTGVAQVKRGCATWSAEIHSQASRLCNAVYKYNQNSDNVNSKELQGALTESLGWYSESFTWLHWMLPDKFIPLTDSILKWLASQRLIKDEASGVTADEYFVILGVIRKSLLRADFTVSQISDLFQKISTEPQENWPTLNTTDSKDHYTKTEFLNDVYMPADKYDLLVNALLRKKNIILQGPPGVGKTFAARRLCHSLMGAKLNNYIGFVQFHQSTSYESFVMGYKPDAQSGGFTLQLGAFFKFVKRAEQDRTHKYFFIIDEINRGNISKIFGELLMLIEADKRDEAITLTYSEEPFLIPDNIYIIGMMNTADKSLSIIDYALRRRFAFIDFYPNYDTESFRRYQRVLNSPKFDKLVEIIEEMNETIANDLVLGEGFMIGHSYLCNCQAVTSDWLFSVVEYDIIPLIREYWADEKTKLSKWSQKLRSVLD